MKGFKGDFMTLNELMRVTSYKNLKLEIWGNVTAYNLAFGAESDESESYYPSLIDTLYLTTKTSRGHYDDKKERLHVILKRFVQHELSHTVKRVVSDVTCLDKEPLLIVSVTIDDVSAYKQLKQDLMKGGICMKRIHARDIKNKRFKDGYDSLLYAVLLQAAEDNDQEFLSSRFALDLYHYLMSRPKYY